MDVAVNDLPHRQEQLDEVVTAIHAQGRRSIAVYADVSDESQVRSMISKVTEELGGLDVVSITLLYMSHT